MGSLIRAAAMRGYPELVRELGSDPAAMFARFGIPAGAERDENAFISFAALTRMLEATAEELSCPDFGLRLSRSAGPGHPRADSGDRAQRVHRARRAGGDRAVSSTSTPRPYASARRPSAGSGIEFTYEMTEPGVPYVQAYELSMGIAVRIIRLLGGPQARVRIGLVPACPTGLGRRLPRRAGLPGALRTDMVRVHAVVTAGRAAHRERRS